MFGTFLFTSRNLTMLRLPEMGLNKKQMSPKNFERLVLFNTVTNKVTFGLKLFAILYIISGLMWKLQ